MATTTQDKIANQLDENRQLSNQRGNDISSNLTAQQQYYQNLQDSYRGQADTAYNDLQQTPGYTPDQSTAIAGDPNAAFKYYQPDALSGDAAGNAADLNKSVSGYQTGLNTAAGNVQAGLSDAAGANATGVTGAANTGAAALNQVPQNELQYQGGVYDYLKGANDTNTGNYGTALNAATDTSKLSLDPNFAADYALSPQEQQNIKNIAATGVQGQYQKMSDQASEQAAAQGNTSPAALAAIKEQMGRQGAIDAGTAAAGAELNANTEAANRLQTTQGMQLASQQDIANREASNATNLYGANSGAATGLANLEQGGIENAAGTQLSAASQGANLGYNAAANAGAENYDAAKTGGTFGYQAADSGGTAANAATQYNGSQKLATDTGNQQTGQTLATNADTAASNRATTIGNAAIAGGDKYRTYLTGQQGQAQSGSQTASGQQIQNYGTESGAANTSTATNSQNQTANHGADVTAGDATKSLVSSLFKDGGVVTKPTMAIVGDDGPERIVSLKRPYQRYRMESYAA